LDSKKRTVCAAVQDQIELPSILSWLQLSCLVKHNDALKKLCSGLDTCPPKFVGETYLK